MKKRKKKKHVIVIKVDDCNVAMGHQQHITGTGVHKDKRKRRNRTRQNSNQKAIRDSSE